MNKRDFLQEPVENCLLQINFIERFRGLSNKFQIRDESFHIENEKIMSICKEFGFLIKYSKAKEFYITDKLNDFEFTFGFSIRFNSFDFGMSAKSENKNIFSSAPWHFFADLIDENNKINRLQFRSYSDLETILKDAFNIYKDFKAELIKL
jgi:hypothetical protein